MTTLEEIYQKYFGCDVPFNKHGRLTKSGAEAQEKLFSLLQDLETIKVIDDARLSMVQADEISGCGISYCQEMCNDLMRFVTSGNEEYELEKPVIVESPDGETFKVKFLSRDTDYNDIFMTEEPWKTDEDNNIDIGQNGPVFELFPTKAKDKNQEWATSREEAGYHTFTGTMYDEEYSFRDDAYGLVIVIGNFGKYDGKEYAFGYVIRDDDYLGDIILTR